MCSEINQNASLHPEYKKPMQTELDNLIRFAKGFKDMHQDKMEYSAKLFFEKLTNLYQRALLLGALNKESEGWIIPALNYLKDM